MFREVKEEKNFGIKKGGLFSSNSVEVLFEHLKVNLFPEATIDMFSERLLLAPSLGMQQWIQMQLASSLAISCGFTTTFLNKGVNILREKMFCSQRDYFLPTKLELFLRIVHEIEQIYSSSDPLWQPLVTYVQGKELRQIALAKHLTQLFERYGIYANRASLAWETSPSNWQEALWAKIFQEWDYPQRVLLECQGKETIPELSVHLFAFSHLSPLHFYFFCKVSRYVPVYFYQLSPCQEFWSDLPLDHPSLLGSMGKVGREMAKLVERSDTSTEEAYIIFGGNTQLKQLQRDLLTLQTADQILDDDSIQVHVSTTPHQEIENLYRLLNSLLAAGGIEPKDVIVMAPQISFYAPYIQSIFGKEIEYQIADMPMQQSHLLVGGLFLLLDLEKKRWSAPAVLELFDHPLFCKKHALSEEDLLQIKTWVQKTGARWAIDGEHRISLLKKGHCQKNVMDATATWMESFGHLIEELALSSAPERINLHQAETLGNFIVLIKALYADLKALDTQKTLQGWVAFLKQLVETYFIFSDDSETFFAGLEKNRKCRKTFSQ